MELRQFGKTDMRVSVLGFGGAEIGFEKAEPEAVARLLDEALDAGLNVIDTAECYLDSEELIGQAVARRRDDFYLFTKCGHPESRASADWRPESLLASIERSLKRLRTDRVDLVQLHSCSEDELRKGDVIAALQEAREQGLHALHRLQRRRPGGAVRDRVRRLRHAPDLGQHRRPGGDRADAAAGPRAEHGRHRQAADRQRRLAVRREAGERLPPALLGAAARSSTTTSSGRARRRRPPRRCGSRWASPACTRRSSAPPSPAAGGRTPPCSRPGRCRREHEAIRARWRQVADAGWVGQV